MQHDQVRAKPVIRQIFITLRYSWVNVIGFELLYKILVALLRPLAFAALKALSTAGGYPVLLNEQIGQFLTSAAGIGLLLLLIPLSVIAIYYEFSVLLTYLYAGWREKTVPFAYGLVQGRRALRNLWHASSLGLTAYLLLLLPLLNIPLYSSLLPKWQIPAFVTGELIKYPGGPTVLQLLNYAPLLLFLAWCFVIPVMVLEGANFRQSLKRNVQQRKRNLLRTLLALGLALASWELSTRLLNRFDSRVMLLFGIAAALVDILQIFSTPLLLTVVLVCYLRNDAPVILALEDVDYERSFAKRLWNRAMPRPIRKKPALLLLLLIIPIWSNTFQSHTFRRPCLVIGHRGSMQGVENSIESVLNAAAQGADYVEIDVLLSADGVPFVIHDDNLLRLSGRLDFVHNLTSQQLKEVVIRQNGYESAIPTLDALCKAVKGKATLLVELKSHGHEQADIVDAVVQVLADNGMAEPSIFHTSEYDLLEALKRKHPRYIAGYVLVSSVGDIAEELPKYQAADFFSIESSIARQSLLDKCSSLKKPAYVWTVNDEEGIRDLLSSNVSGIITDDPGATRQAITQLLAAERR